MTKKEANELIQYLNSFYVYGGLRKMTKSELMEYVRIFYEMFIRFDKQLVNDAITKAATTSNFFLNFAELNKYVSDMLLNRRYEIVKKLIDNKYFEIGMTGTKYEIERKAFNRFDKILVEMITYKYSYVTINEIENAVNVIDYLKEYRGLVLFDDKLPIPLGVTITIIMIFQDPQPTYIHKNKNFP